MRQALQELPARRVRGGLFVHDLKYIYFHNKSQQKSACAKKIFPAQAKVLLTQRLLREERTVLHRCSTFLLTFLPTTKRSPVATELAMAMARAAGARQT